MKGGDSPEPGEPGPFCVGQTTTYGVTIGNGTNGKGYIQAGRFDGSSVTYGLNLNPHGGGIGIGNGTKQQYLLTLPKRQTMPMVFHLSVVRVSKIQLY